VWELQRNGVWAFNGSRKCNFIGNLKDFWGDEADLAATKGVFLFEFRCRLATKISGSDGPQPQRFGRERRRFCVL
jgi:hypothetical protein